MKFRQFIFSRIFLKHLLFAVIAAVVIVLGTLLWLHLYTYHGKSRPVPDLTALTMDEVEEIVKKNKMRYVVFDSAYTDLVPRGTVYEQNPRPGTRVKKDRKIFLTMNAVLPDSVAVPNIIGNSLRQARAILENNGLMVGKLNYYPDIAINNVLRIKYHGQEIQPGKNVVKGSAIDLDLGQGLSNRKTIPPDLIALRLEEAKRRILNASLNLGAVTYDETVETLKDSLQAFVWKQVPVHNEENQVQLGTSVYVWLTLDSLLLPGKDTLDLNLPPGNEENMDP
ncbi:MAG TPA: PASTA domain-containing protein [Bacteroidetes bacterium]|nr:PASTA domain-containing protein [Bacteroidota bacterium]